MEPEFGDRVRDTLDRAGLSPHRLELRAQAVGLPILWSVLRPGGLFVSNDISDDVAFCGHARKIGRKPLLIGAID